MQRMYGRDSRKVMAVLVAVSMVTAPFGFSQHSVQNGQRRLLCSDSDTDIEEYLVTVVKE